jgi:S1-C subfamily serine protease
MRNVLQWLLPLGLVLVPVGLAQAQNSDAPATLGEAVVDSGQNHSQNVPVQTPEAGVESLLANRQFVLQNLSRLGRHVLLDIDGQPDASGLGLSLEQADRAVRAQLGLPNDRGLVVTSVTDDGPAAHAGLQENDILLTLDEKPLDRPDDFVARLKGVGDKDVPLALIRAGKPLTIRIKPEYRVIFKVVVPEQTKYYIGAAVKGVDATLRAHLPGIPEGQGLVVDEVAPGSPAERAGLKLSDIMLMIGSSPVADLDSFIARIQANGGKSVVLHILREGKPMTIQVTPEPRGNTRVSGDSTNPARENVWSLKLQEHAVADLNRGVLYLLNERVNQAPRWRTLVNPSQPDQGVRADLTEKRLDALHEELKQLRESVDALRQSLKPADKPGGEPKR